jgi:hypothetical protein
MAPALQNQCSRLDDFVADLTEATYSFALRNKDCERWLDLKLDLWRVIARTVETWEHRMP